MAKLFWLFAKALALPAPTEILKFVSNVFLVSISTTEDAEDVQEAAELAAKPMLPNVFHAIPTLSWQTVIVLAATPTAELVSEPKQLPTVPAAGMDFIYKTHNAARAALKTVSLAPILPPAPNASLDTLLSQEMVK